MAALRAKSLALTDLFITLIHQRCAAHGLRVMTPLAHAERGSQVSVMLAAGRDEGYAVMQALIARGVIGDYRTGILRFGFTPLYVGFADVWLAVAHLAQVLDGEEWRRPAFAAQHTVT
jgi:kynureninase